MFSEDPLYIPQMCLISFVSLEVTPEVGVVRDASLLQGWLCCELWGLKVVGHCCICDLLGSGTECHLSPRQLMENREKYSCWEESLQGSFWAFLFLILFPPLERGDEQSGKGD